MHQIIIKLSESIKSHGGRALLVGGCVRDQLLGIEPHDFDIEVYNIEPAKLRSIAESFGEVIDVGSTFGILKLQVPLDSPSIHGGGRGVALDLSIPRRDSKVSLGHNGFAINVDPTMTFIDAARRRDFTINAIMFDPLTNEFIDPFDGRLDLRDRILRVVDSEAFGDDPLRVMRAMQFVARFDLMVDELSMKVMKKCVPSLVELSEERLRDEWRKLLTLSIKPSIGLQLGFDLGVFDVIHPELPPLKLTPQNPAWHPEGDVWIHTKMVVDEAAGIVRRENIIGDERFMIILAALCHDLGKALCTRMMDGVWRSIGHEEAGETPARSFLKKVGVNQNVIETIVGITKDHLKPTKYYLDDVKNGKPITDGAIRKLAARIAPATMNELLLVAEADYFGRGQWRHGETREYPERSWLLGRAAKIDVLAGPAPHIITGSDLIERGIEPGPKMGEIITKADQLRDDEGMMKEEILERLSRDK